MSTTAEAIFLLPALAELRGDLDCVAQFAQRMGRADPLIPGQPGREAQLLRHFDVLPRRLSAAALSRRLDADDAATGGWLRCDPAHVRADGPLLRLLAWGEQLAPETDEVEQLLVELRPLFGDRGALLSAPHPGRWYAAVTHAESLPPMSSPQQAAGEDLLAHLPPGREGLRWRQLWNESQVILHNHPVNQRRIRLGKPAINSLWFWGGGCLPDSVRSECTAVISADASLQALAGIAGLPVLQPQDQFAGRVLIDLQRLRDVAELERDLLPEVEQGLRRARWQRVQLDFADGARFQLQLRQRWRLWRRPLRQWPAVSP